MSLALTALRLQAIAALDSHPVIARLCGGRLYDSRLGDFNHTEPVPVITVSTEEFEGQAWSENNGGAPFDDRCNLVLEIAMNTLVTVPGEGDPEFAIASPATDRELEATLNLLAWCAETMLTLGTSHPLTPQTPQGALLLAAVTRRVEKRSVARFSSNETAERLAIHLVTFLVALKTDEIDANNLPTGPFAGLPEPLRSVCEAAPEGSSAEITCRMIAAELPPPILHPVRSATFARPSAELPDTPFDPLSADFPIPDPPA